MDYEMGQKEIPVTVIGGYLGAGKTTLLNHILRNNAGIRLAVLVNDFGKINIDAELIESEDGDTINLANGCICCSLAGGFGSAMLALRERAVPPERVVIEASGVSDPFKVAQYAHMSGFKLDSVVVVADVETIQKQASNKYVGRQVVQQLKSADLLLLNKIDLVSGTERLEVIRWLRDLVPDIRILEGQDGRVPTELLFANEFLATGKTAVLAASNGNEQHEHHPDSEYVTWSYEGDHPLDGIGLRTLIAGLNVDVLRGKGFLYLSEDVSSQYIFQLVGKRWSVVKGEAWRERQPKTQMVLIGLPGSLVESDLNTKVSGLLIS